MLDTPRRLWAAGAACAAAFVALLVVVYTTERGARADVRALEGFGALQRPRVAELADAVAHAADPLPFAVISLVLVAVAFMRARPVHGLAAGVVLLGANVTTQVLKPALAYPRGTFGEYGVAAEAFPSGHGTGAMSLALAAVIVAPAWWRPLAGLVGVGFAVAVGFSIVSLDWHFPSDVAGGYLVAAGWCFAALALVRAYQLRAPGALPREDPPAWWLAAAALAVPLVVLGWLALARLPRLTGYAEGHTTFAMVAAATVALAVVLVGGALSAVSHRDRAAAGP